MSDHEVRIADEAAEPAAGWQLEWLDRATGRARLVGTERSIGVVVEGAGTEWFVTLRGRRIGVTVRTWRERLLAEAATSGQVHSGPIEVKATLPGLVVAVAVAVGDEVDEGSSLLTIEAMKMQNEVRAPRAGRVIAVAVSSGQAVATGASLLRLE
ncbi:MAG: acetyl-CoA carboxylase biotin carboxyl carrier protein subunit [Candidatus Limnocylindria bacterium]